jgi:hypothetical protein
MVYWKVEDSIEALYIEDKDSYLWYIQSKACYWRQRQNKTKTVKVKVQRQDCMKIEAKKDKDKG